jgi:hypothetical protein
MQSRRLVRPVDPKDEARLQRLAEALDGRPLPEATRLVEQGLIVDARGTKVEWKPVGAVIAVSERLRALVSGTGYAEAVARERARLAYRPGPTPP